MAVYWYKIEHLMFLNEYMIIGHMQKYPQWSQRSLKPSWQEVSQQRPVEYEYNGCYGQYRKQTQKYPVQRHGSPCPILGHRVSVLCIHTTLNDGIEAILHLWENTVLMEDVFRRWRPETGVHCVMFIINTILMADWSTLCYVYYKYCSDERFLSKAKACNLRTLCYGSSWCSALFILSSSHNNIM